jgi:hypothetical protein
MPKVNTYLSFDGTTSEAMRFYEKALGAKLDVLMKFGDMPETARMPGVKADRVMHAQLTFANGDVLIASDWIDGTPYQGMKGFLRRSRLSDGRGSEARLRRTRQGRHGPVTFAAIVLCKKLRHAGRPVRDAMVDQRRRRTSLNVF